MTLSIIGPGFGRTGTNTLKLALEQLGFGPCHHMFEVIARPESAADWQHALDGAPVDWDTVLQGYDSQVDWPGAYFWREIREWSPNAQVLLSVRDEEAWFKSITNTIFAVRADPEKIEDPSQRKFALMVNELIDRAIGSKDRDRNTVLAAYKRNIDEVTSEVPPEKLLKYDVRQGWEPLCEFLDVTVPDTPLPRTNSTEDFLSGIRKRR
jgi:Sulfotransferase domain